MTATLCSTTSLTKVNSCLLADSSNSVQWLNSISALGSVPRTSGPILSLVSALGRNSGLGLFYPTSYSHRVKEYNPAMPTGTMAV